MLLINCIVGYRQVDVNVKKLIEKLFLLAKYQVSNNSSGFPLVGLFVLYALKC